MSDRRGLRADDRAVSEAISFVLVFSLIVMVVAISFAGGVSSLQDIRDVERVTNAERAFDVFADNVADVTAGDAPSRATEVKLAEAALYVDDPVVVNVSAVHASQPSRSFTREYEVQPLVYESRGGELIVYSNGAVIRQGESSVMSRTPDLVLSTDRVVVPLTVTRAGERRSVSGSQTVLVRTDRAVTRVVAARSDGPYERVYLNVTSPRADAWAAHLDAREDVSCTLASGTASCEISAVERVFVTVVEMDVELE